MGFLEIVVFIFKILIRMLTRHGRTFIYRFAQLYFCADSKINQFYFCLSAKIDVLPVTFDHNIDLFWLYQTNEISRMIKDTTKLSSFKPSTIMIDYVFDLNADLSINTTLNYMLVKLNVCKFIFLFSLNRKHK